MSENDTDERPAEAVLPGINGVSYEIRRAAIDNQQAALESEAGDAAPVAAGEDVFAVQDFDEWVVGLSGQHSGVRNVEYDEFASEIRVVGSRGQRAHFLTAGMAEKFLRNGYVVVEVGPAFVTLRQLGDDHR